MTKQSSFKKQIRARMKKTGERYAAARLALLSDGRPKAPRSGPRPVTGYGFRSGAHGDSARLCSALAQAGVVDPATGEAFTERMVVYLGGPVEVAAYGSSGSDELAAAVVEALGPRSAVLLAAHGVLTTGKDLRKAFKNAELVEHVAQVVTLAGRRFPLAEGETIRTEYSHKYSIDGFQRLAAAVGFRGRQVWTDPEPLFAVCYLDRA